MRTINSNKPQLAPGSTISVKKPEKFKRIRGLVTGIVDGNTFEMSVQNGNGYSAKGEKRQEIIRIYGMDKPAASTLSGILAKLELEKKIVGRTLECDIIEKDEMDQLIAIVPSEYLQPKFSLPSSRN